MRPSPVAAEDSDLPLKWRQRTIEWQRVAPGRLDDVCASLPRIELTPIRNATGAEHAHEADVRLHWPPDGVFASGHRADWSGTSIGSGPSKPTPTQPRAVAAGFRASLAEHAIGAPAYWDMGLTRLGEWWMLRAAWSTGPHAPAERIVEIDHDVRTATIHISGGLRQPGDAAILASYEQALLSGPRLTGRRPRTTLLQAVWDSIVELEANLDEWSEQRVDRTTLAAWIRRYVTPEWGPETGPRLLLHDEQNAAADGSSLADVCWTLASSLLGVDDVNDRRELQHEIRMVVDHLANFPPAAAAMAPDALSGAGGRRVH